MSHLVLVVEDDPVTRHVLRAELTDAGYAVIASDSGTEGLQQIAERAPDLVILDIGLPGIDGLEICRRLRARDADLPILFLTGRDSAADQIAGLDMGANDYMTKPFDPDVLLARVRALLRALRRGTPGRMEFEDVALDATTYEAWRGERALALTTMEFNLLRFLLAHPRQVLSKEQALQQIWGYDFVGSTNVVEVHISNLRRKLEAAGEPRLIHTVRNAGYVLKR